MVIHRRSRSHRDHPENGRHSPSRLRHPPLAALCIVLALLAAGCSNGGTETTSSSTSAPSQGGILDDVVAPEWEPATRTEGIAERLSSGEVTAQSAIDALALIADDVPGATPSDLPVGEGFGGYYTRLLIDAVRPDLTPAQATFVEAYYMPGRLVGRIGTDGTIEPGDSPSAAGVEAVAGANRSTFVAPVAVLAAAKIGDLEYLELVAEVQQRWKAHLADMPAFEIELHMSDKPGGMEAWNDGVCHIEVQAGFTKEEASADQVRWFFAHEIFHCIQSTWEGSASPPPWVVEGAADFAAYDLFRNEKLDFEGGSSDWFVNAYTPLKVRAYSAWPLFENARRSGIDVYASIRKMMASPGNSVAANLAVGGLDGKVFRRDWSTRTLRNPAFDGVWWLPWPTHDPQAGPQTNAYALERGLGSYNVVGAGGFAQPQMAVLVTPDVGMITASPLGGPLTTWTALGTRTVADGSSGKFCFSPDGCQCPGGTSSSAIPMSGSSMVFSYPASEEAVKAAVVAEPWDPDDECKEDPPHDDAESNGDPHLLTFDGLAYDVITLGEFITARDPNGDFEVQTRHEAFRFGAGTSAVALGTGSSRITITSPDLMTPEAVIRVDGSAVTGASFEAGGVAVEVGDLEITATWPDGSTVELRWFLGWFVEMSVPPERSARMVGLVGSADGDFGNDLRFPDGTIVDTTDAQVDESPFVVAWAVDEETTLFDYEPGETPATFRVPHPNPIPPQIEEDALAECSAALGDQATSHEVWWCAYDVSATGESGFVDEYVREVEDRVGGGSVGPPPTATTTTGEPPAGSVSGEPTLVLDATQPSGLVSVAAGTVLVAIATDCPEELYLDISVYAVDDDSLLARASLCDPSGLGGITADEGEWYDGEAYLWLPETAEYEIFLEEILGDAAAAGAVAIYTDPTPAVLTAADLADGDTRTLGGIADSVVYLPDPAMTFDLVGFEVACGVEIYWLDTFPRLEPWNLAKCGHADRFDLPPTDQVFPFVVFSRTPDPIEITLTPTG